MHTVSIAIDLQSAKHDNKIWLWHTDPFHFTTRATSGAVKVRIFLHLRYKLLQPVLHLHAITYSNLNPPAITIT